MPVWLDILLVTIIALALLLYSGIGLSLWLVPSNFHNRLYLLTPFTGLFVIDALSHLTSYANLPGVRSIWIFGGVTTIINITAAIWRPSSWRLPNRFEWLLFICAFPTIPLNVGPMVPHGELLPVTDSSNADPISHVATTDWLRQNGIREPIEQSVTRPINGPVTIKVKSDVRIGFHFYQMYVDVLSNHKAYATFSIIAAISLYLWSLATGFFVGCILATNEKYAYLATLLISINALPLWIAFGGYGPQFLGMGLLIMAFSLWSNALQTGARPQTILAGIFSSAFAGIYSDALPYIIVPVGLFGLMQIIIRNKNSPFLQIIKTGLLGTSVTLIVNPIGWYRAISRSLYIVQGGGGANIDWWVDLREVVGLIPFHKISTYWFDECQIQLLAVVAISLGLLALYGFNHLERQAQTIVISFVLPHIGSLLWLYQQNETYKYFKGWSMGLFLYLGLISIGFITLFQQKQQKKILRIIGIAGVSITISLFGRASIMLSHSLIDRITSPPEVIDLARWTAELPPETKIFISTGDLSRISVLWATYHLQSHRPLVDETVVYTKYAAQPYRGEAFAIRYTNGTRYWPVPLWGETIREKNSIFEFLDITAENRQYELNATPININAQLGDIIQLVGYEADFTDVKPGDLLQLTLYWQALAKTDRSYKVFIHLLSEDGRLGGQFDGIPINWTYHTYFWQPGEFITDTYEIKLAPDTPIGSYKILVGMYREDSGQRLEVSQNGIHSPESTINLATNVLISN